MGGDDLASDDEYVFGGASDGSDNESVSSEVDDNNKISTSKKRKVNNNGDDLNSAQVVVGVSKKRKNKKKKHDASGSSKSLLIMAGRGIAQDRIPSQVKFINTLYAHSIKMSMGASTEDQADNDEASIYSFTSEDFYSTPPETDEKTKLYRHKNIDAFLKGGPVSMKRLKNWKHPASPMALIVTLSARRSVELMKGLASLKLPVAKLFAKHFRVEEQVEMLQGQRKGGGGKKKSYSIAVGTPGRLLSLLRHGRDEQGSDNGLGALRLNHTEVIIFDTHEDSKGFNVCTLKDT